MYSRETITSVTSQFKNRTRDYIKSGDASAIKMAISKGNRKIGRVMNVSLPPILTCANCKECMYLCYDIKACAQYPDTVIDARARNLAILRLDRDDYFARIDTAMSRRKKNKFFRWHVAGDIVDIDYFDRMVKNARKHQDFIIWTYTKNYKVVNEWIAKNGQLPENFHVMFSEWRGLPMDNPYNMPEFRIVFKDDAIKPTGHYCPGNCDICKAMGRGCIAGETTYCNEH